MTDLYIPLAVAGLIAGGYLLGWASNTVRDRCREYTIWDLRMRLEQAKKDVIAARLFSGSAEQERAEGALVAPYEEAEAREGLVDFPSLWPGGPVLQVVGDDTGEYAPLRKRALWAMRPRGDKGA